MGSEEEDNSVITLTDNLLLKGITLGDTISFETLFHQYYDRIYGLLFRLLGNRVEAEDVTQEVFLKLYYHRFDNNREHNVGAWLYQVATNMGYNHIRSRKRLWHRNMLLLPDASDNSHDPATRVERKQNQAETQLRVRAALAQLPERQTQLLLLRQMGMSYNELAEICQVAPGSVGTLLARAGRAFREAYEVEAEQ
jgi:RNA polymerase sigma-70 factor, ECF subfamily